MSNEVDLYFCIFVLLAYGSLFFVIAIAQSRRICKLHEQKKLIMMPGDKYNVTITWTLPAGTGRGHQTEKEILISALVLSNYSEDREKFDEDKFRKHLATLNFNNVFVFPTSVPG